MPAAVLPGVSALGFSKKANPHPHFLSKAKSVRAAEPFAGRNLPAALPIRPKLRGCITANAGLGGDPFDDMMDFPQSRLQDVFDTRAFDESMRQMESRLLESQREVDRKVEEMQRLSSTPQNSQEIYQRKGETSSYFSESYESRGQGYYYQSYTEFRSGPPTYTSSSVGGSPVLLGLVLFLVGAYAAAAAAFNRGYEATKYSEKPTVRWRLILLWPLLFLFSSKFRQEFRLAMQAPKIKQRQAPGQQPPVPPAGP
eukprot:CAMPEP_0117667708 /NCGR_PEP_ID=MMETSP0804-20121206/11127_1 /TAXON_ID=1074897 /ORGANISM="Tetraselmis astigmatica, Strain CCMP880" /LENGTH=254 /DNA_ID=CAMNT_0005475485 /DNA_START=300 /DNA_END=1064 /DNA_ORIENTATION=-